ncbi:hypothetical protein HD806DRAFT_66108 [Xylariaceae sp. AK1471]|nr:hypothetical protein HD806DRAFT_66108 [Xylariaceae sp. AK1471]
MASCALRLTSTTYDFPILPPRPRAFLRGHADSIISIDGTGYVQHAIIRHHCRPPELPEDTSYGDLGKYLYMVPDYMVHTDTYMMNCVRLPCSRAARFHGTWMLLLTYSELTYTISHVSVPVRYTPTCERV